MDESEQIEAAPTQPTEDELGKLPGGLELDLDDDGTRWISCDVLCTGDYGGSGDIGFANQRALPTYAERPDWFFPDDADIEHTRETHGAYHSAQAWCLDTKENRELLTGLVRNYPLLDEETHSEVQMEWEQEALTSWAFGDIGRELESDYDKLFRDLWDELPSGFEDRSSEFRIHFAELLNSEGEYNGPTQCGIYRAAMEVTNSSPTYEYSGAHIPIDSIIDAIAAQILPRIGATENGIAFLTDWLSEDCPELERPEAWTDPACWCCLSDEIAIRNPDASLAAFLRMAAETIYKLASWNMAPEWPV